MPQDSNRGTDPQVKVKTLIKKSKINGGEMIVFTYKMGLFELTAICPIPDEGATEGIGYIKHKVREPQPRPTSNKTNWIGADITHLSEDNDDVNEQLAE